MYLFKCPVCSQRPGEKPTTVYWAWQDVEGGRHAYRQKMCRGCFADQVAPLDKPLEPGANLTCPHCGIDTEADYDAMWANCFIPSYGRHDIEAPTCGACAAKLRIWVIDHSDPAEDRSRADIGPRPGFTGDEVLRAMGIVPRASR